MEIQENKCVLIINSTLSAGVIANVAGILSMTIGNRINGLIGEDIKDNDGIIHAGLTRLPIPVLGANASQITDVRNNFLANVEPTDFLVDFNNFAQSARTYEEYIIQLSNADNSMIEILGIGLFGKKQKINKLTKGLSLIGN